MRVGVPGSPMAKPAGAAYGSLACNLRAGKMTADVTRRDALKLLALSSGAAVACSRSQTPSEPAATTAVAEPVTGQSSVSPVLTTRLLPLAGSWQVPDPFLFCVHHDDGYPAGNESMGPAASLEGRNIGQDFDGKDGWNMYHGRIVPGFPAHPHRGFETVTVVRRGLLDHADSLGAAARYGEGDVQWLTAGAGIQHAEMFPLLDRTKNNPLELFQIWLNLPSRDKMVAPHFTMLWADTIPAFDVKDDAGKVTHITLRAGRLGDLAPPAPPPSSWAARPENEVAIWTLKMAPGARWTLPKASPGLNRSLYFFRGNELRVAGRTVDSRRQIELRSDADVLLENTGSEAELLMLQGRPIGEPVAKRGPFVMNTPAEVQQAFSDYRQTRFGGWPWDGEAPVHGRDPARFARRPDGSVERPT